MATKTYKYGTLQVELEEELTSEQVRDFWSSIYPELKNASIEEHDDGSIEFVERAGEKG